MSYSYSKFDQKKIPLFNESLNKFKQNGGKGIVIYPTGVGKTVLSVYLISKFLKEQKEGKRGKTIVLVNNQIIKKQFINSICYFLNEDIETVSRNIIVSTPDTLDCSEKLQCELLIIDEIHNYTTQRKMEFIDKTRIDYRFCLGLTATLNKNDAEIINSYLPTIHEITIQYAMDNKFIPKLIEYNYGIEFDKTSQIRYDMYNSKIKEATEKYGGYQTILKCVVGERNYLRDTSPIEFREQLAAENMYHKDMICDNQLKKDIFREWNPEKIKEETTRAFNYYKQRADLTDNYIIKADEAVKLYNKLNVSTIFFGKSTALATYIKETIGNECALFHSKIESTTLQDENGNIILQKNGKPKKFGQTYFKKDAVEGIKTGKYKCLSTVMALNEGLDVSNLKLAIITAGTHNTSQQAQRKGRVLRFENYLNKDDKSCVVNIYIKNTRDEDKLLQRQSDSNNYVKFIDNFNELCLDIKNNL